MMLKSEARKLYSPLLHAPASISIVSNGRRFI